MKRKTSTLLPGDNGSKSVTFEGLDSSKTYYVFELDKDGDTIVPDGGMTEVGKKTFVASYSNGNMVTMMPAFRAIRPSSMRTRAM